MILTEIIQIDEKNTDAPGELLKLRRAAEIIKNGGLVVFPTETVYGLGANAFDETAVKKIYEAKGRPPDNPLIVHLADPEDIYKYAEVTEAADKMIKKFLPAPLTFVLKKKNKALDCVSPYLDTVALRVPQNKTARKLIGLAGVPIAAPSANLSGRPSHTNAEHIIKDLNGRVDMIICGENSEIGIESTVVSFNSNIPGNSGESVNILRSGYITREMLEEFEVRKSAGNFNGSESPRAPGMKYTHYSPDAPLYILSGDGGKVINFIMEEILKKTKKIGFLCYDEISGLLNERKDCGDDKNMEIISLGAEKDFQEQAKNLFNALNEFNTLGVDIIYSVEPARIEIGEAVYNRLIKAAGGKVINL